MFWHQVTEACMQAACIKEELGQSKLKQTCLEFLVCLSHSLAICFLAPIMVVFAEESHSLAVKQEQGPAWQWQHCLAISALPCMTE